MVSVEGVAIAVDDAYAYFEWEYAMLLSCLAIRSWGSFFLSFCVYAFNLVGVWADLVILILIFGENGLGPGGVFMGVWKMGGLVWLWVTHSCHFCFSFVVHSGVGDKSKTDRVDLVICFDRYLDFNHLVDYATSRSTSPSV